MPTCPTIPSVPQEVLQRFRTMRDYDVRMRKYADGLCAIIPDSADISSILARLDAIEALLASHTALIAGLQVEVDGLVSASAGALTWITVNTSPYTISIHNVGLLVNTSIPIEILLPDVSGYIGESIFIKDDTGDAGTNNITITPNGADTIDDDSELVIDADYSGIEIKGAAEGWEVV